MFLPALQPEFRSLASRQRCDQQLLVNGEFHLACEKEKKKKRQSRHDDKIEKGELTMKSVLTPGCGCDPQAS